MSTAIPSALSEQYTLNTAKENNFEKDLGQDEFLKLMMAQLEHQDPMKPMDNGEFLGQMAQFSTVTGIEEMQTSIDNLTNTFVTSQTLESTQLVGQEVLIENSSMNLGETGSAGGSFEISSASGEVNLDISDSAGNVIRQISMGEFASGRHNFSWDGLNSTGTRAPQGNYTASISARQGEGFVSAVVLTPRVIDSVEFGSASETSLNTTQGESISMAEIRQIRQAVSSN
ncbi:MAG: flagellar hook assembly protein FlgD [Granulosicoccus sp.]